MIPMDGRTTDKEDTMTKEDFKLDDTIDHIQLYDARAIKRLVNMGEPLSTSAAQYGYTPSEAKELLRKHT